MSTISQSEDKLCHAGELQLGGRGKGGEDGRRDGVEVCYKQHVRTGVLKPILRSAMGARSGCLCGRGVLHGRCVLLDDDR